MFLLLPLMILAGSTDTSKLVMDAQRKCEKASTGPASNPYTPLPVDKFDACVVTEANKQPLKTRKAICALGKSGSPSGSTVEVYMANGQCRTDYE